MPFTRPTLTELVTRMQTDVETRLADIGTLLRRSIIKVLIRVLAGAIHLTYGFLNYMVDQLFASTADSYYLEVIAAEYGLYRTAAAYASGSGTVTATIATTIPQGTRLQSSEGQVYTVDEDTILAVGSNTVDFTAESAGADGNDDASVSLSFVSSITGVSATLTVDSNGIAGGADEESDDDLRDRVLYRKKRPPHGGAEHDYVNWAKEYSGVTRAWVYPGYSGLGSVALAFVMDDNDSIIPNAAQRTAVSTYISEHVNPVTGETVGIPVTAQAGFEVVTLTEYEIDITVQIYPNTSAVQTAVESELESFLLESGGPGVTLYLSQIDEIISGSAGEQRHKITYPTSDISPTFVQMPTVFNVTFEDYS